jgi:hypothetical protein
MEIAGELTLSTLCGLSRMTEATKPPQVPKTMHWPCCTMEDSIARETYLSAGQFARFRWRGSLRHAANRAHHGAFQIDRVPEDDRRPGQIERRGAMALPLRRCPISNRYTDTPCDDLSLRIVPTRGRGHRSCSLHRGKKHRCLHAGQPAQHQSLPKVLRGFCSSCGTALTYWHNDWPTQFSLTIASLDNPSLVVPVDHTWMALAVPWDSTTDRLPRHQTDRR